MVNTRVLQNSANRLLESGGSLVLENSLTSQAYASYPMSPYPWTDRFGITKPDVLGPTNLTTLSIGPTGTGNYTSLVITADSVIPMVVGVAVVLWDNRSNPISVGSGMITLADGRRTRRAIQYLPTDMGVTLQVSRCGRIDGCGYTVLLQSTSVANYAALGTVTTGAGSPVIVGTSTGFLGTMVGMYVIFRANQ